VPPRPHAATTGCPPAPVGAVSGAIPCILATKLSQSCYIRERRARRAHPPVVPRLSTTPITAQHLGDLPESQQTHSRPPQHAEARSAVMLDAACSLPNIGGAPSHTYRLLAPRKSLKIRPVAHSFAGNRLAERLPRELPCAISFATCAMAGVSC
jgi:hypothetical protein